MPCFSTKKLRAKRDEQELQNSWNGVPTIKKPRKVSCVRRALSGCGCCLMGIPALIFFCCCQKKGNIVEE